MSRAQIVRTEREWPHKVVTCPSEDFQTLEVIGMALTTDIPIAPPYGDRQVNEARDRALRAYDRALRSIK